MSHARLSSLTKPIRFMESLACLIENARLSSSRMNSREDLTKRKTVRRIGQAHAGARFSSRRAKTEAHRSARATVAQSKPSQ